MKMTKAKLLILLFVLTTGTINNLFSQSDPDRIKRIEAAIPVIDGLFRDFAAQNHLPGFVYGLVVDGRLIHTGSFGYSNLAEKFPVNNKSEFRIASMTKSFTAMAILRLRDEKRLNLDDPVYLYIPEMKGQKYLTKDAADITIRNLLTHSAGFPEDNPWGDRQLDVTEEELIGTIKKGISFSSNPGTGYEYSNMGFAMLGYIIAKVSGQSYSDYITENILKPLGMNQTFFEYSKIPDRELALGYRWLNGKWEEQPYLHDGAYGSMGGMISSADDFSRYVSFHLSAWPPRNDEEMGPLKRSSLREMQSPWNLSGFDPEFRYPGGRECPVVTAYGYGLGWMKDCDGRVMIGHGGGLPGFGSHWRILPDYGIGIFSFSNLTYAPVGFINLKALDTIIAIANLKPARIAVSEILNQRKNELLKLLPEWTNAEKTHIFAENFFMDYSPEALRNEAVEIFRKAGKIKNIQEIIPENNLRGSFIIECEKGNIEISFTLTPENPPLIQEYHLREKLIDK